jgi:hypothetical protein
MTIQTQRANSLAQVVCDGLRGVSAEPHNSCDHVFRLIEELSKWAGEDTTFAQRAVAEAEQILTPPCDADFEYLSDSGD